MPPKVGLKYSLFTYHGFGHFQNYTHHVQEGCWLFLLP